MSVRSSNLRLVGVDEEEERIQMHCVVRDVAMEDIVIWKMDDLQLELTEEFSDPLKQFTCIKTTSGWDSAFFVVGYFAPRGATIYNVEDSDPYEGITRFIGRIREKGPMWALGDFNCWIRVAQCENTLDLQYNFETPNYLETLSRAEDCGMFGEPATVHT
ncbi:hypothetical protein R1sor_000929 [Riccia sorocarpa]|uniref:Uncharacterized protein n=1 Tax=Riccia sorocarpa TaxID=122646 RepID=A0ABD3GUH8_9MARC